MTLIPGLKSCTESELEVLILKAQKWSFQQIDTGVPMDDHKAELRREILEEKLRRLEIQIKAWWRRIEEEPTQRVERKAA